MKSLYYALLFFVSSATAASDTALKACTVISPTTERFFDLNPIRRVAPEDGKKKKEGADEGSWHARGYDYGANFTINFCGPVVEELDKVQDLDKALWRNVSAFYEKGDRQYAIGLENSSPMFRGRKLVLNYTGGSLCPSTSKSRRSPITLPRAIIDDDDDDDDDKKHSKKPSHDERRKTTVISLLCDSDPLAKTSISFVASVDDCTYIFEGRSPYACGGVHQATQALGPGGVFGVIAMIAVLVYFAGGCVYQRTVMHQRGWRQLPNYSMWAGIYSFFSDIFIILTSSCARFMPARRGYSRVSLGHDSGRRGRGNEDENRLIDNLDEEWED
ncbi:mannose 6-phosphate receptor domain-containing protein [Dothidotthia symphoricarpi CBS 119687]|uniref:Mannose 6-phosphate receptor domain-containing protein n=1 Tax=Dothidotthia symphoricarpi CBS 119687 TaxID=1392245 RepID=A0A6A6AAK9_9PLEO|nr:mannose 6-phosphate receptor domain-containing protein [Dothidotthia symphoricarpi CBS 119687]KAF2128829.1 mannose 6-phosphate receptor domain-containing protein [Dothidotthia symphoricarpi CBS 119687]